MFKLALKNLWEHKVRLLASAVAVFLGVAFLAGTFVFTDSLRGVFDDLFSSVYKGTDVLVQGEQAFKAHDPSNSTRARLTAAQLDRVKAVNGVASAAGGVQGFAQVIDKKGKLVGRSGPPKFGYNWIADPRLGVYKLFSGRAPAADNEIVVDRGVMKSAKFTLGDTIKVATQKPTESFTIVGDATFGSSDASLGSSAVFFTTSKAQSLFGQPGQFDAIRARVAKGVSPDQLVSNVKAALKGQKVEVLSAAAATALARSLVSGFFDTFQTVLSVFAYIALFVGTFVIYNSFKIVFTQRTREMAMLRAIGASQRQILSSTVIESFIVGLLSSIVGVAGGVGLAVGLKALLNAIGATLPSGALVLAPRTVIVGVLVGLVTTMVSSLLPAIKASRVKPLAALRDVAVDRTGTAKSRLFGAVALYALGAVTLAVGLAGKGTPGAKILGISAVAVLVGTIVIGPIISKPLAAVFGAPWFGWVVTVFGVVVSLAGIATIAKSFGDKKPAMIINGLILLPIGIYLFRTGRAAPTTPGRIARENAMRNPSRTSATALALTISTALVSALFVFSTSITDTFTGALSKSIKADFLVASASQEGFSGDVSNVVAKLPGVVAISPFRFVEARVGFASKQLGAVDASTIARVLDIGKTEGDISALAQPNTIAVASRTLKSNDWKIGQKLTFRFGNNKTADLTLVATYSKPEGLANTYYLTTIKTLAPYSNTDLDQFVYVQTDGKDDAAFKKAGEKALADYPTAKLQTKKEFEKEQVGQLNQVLGIILALLGLSMFVAIVGIANTLKLSVLERTRELGLLRAIGMGREQTKSMVRWEAIVVATIGAIIGLLIGTAYGAALVHVLGKDGSLTLGVPFPTIIGLALAASIIGLYAARRPAKRASKLNILQAIATE